MDFVLIALEELADNIEEKLRYNALSHRLSKLEPDDFNTFMQEKDSKSTNTEIDHLAQMKQATQG